MSFRCYTEVSHRGADAVGVLQPLALLVAVRESGNQLVGALAPGDAAEVAPLRGRPGWGAQRVVEVGEESFLGRAGQQLHSGRVDMREPARAPVVHARHIPGTGR